MRNREITVVGVTYPSRTCPDQIAIDVDLRVGDIDVETTLLPAEDGRGVWESWGQGADNWCSWTDFSREVLTRVEGVAVEAAEAAHPCPWHPEGNRAACRAALEAEGRLVDQA